MPEEIKAGDLVMVKSGGPVMTVAWVEEGRAYCEWFDSKKEHQGDSFYLTVLKPVQGS